MNIYQRIKKGEFDNHLPYESKSKNREVWEAYQDADKRINAAFREALEEEFGDDEWSQEVFDALFARAWEDGHSAGYPEVAGRYAELSELVHIAFDAGVEEGSEDR